LLKSENQARGSVNDAPAEDRREALQTELQHTIRAAAVGHTRLPDLIQSLAGAGVHLEPSISRKGRVTALNYRFNGEVVKSSALGKEFTWNGLQNKLGVVVESGDDIRQLMRDAASGDVHAIEPQQGGSVDAEPVVSGQPEAVGAGASFEPVRQHPVDDAGGVAMADTQQETQRPDLAREFETLKHDAIAELKKEFEKIRNEELEALSATVAPLGDLTSSVRDDTRQTLAQLEHTSEQMNQRTASAVEHALSQVTEVVGHLDSANSALAERTGEVVKKIEVATTRLRQESLWMTVIAAIVAGLISALVTGLWVSQSVRNEMAASQAAIVEHMDKNAENDVLRNYFNNLSKQGKEPLP
jgi:hypothetical protein